MSRTKIALIGAGWRSEFYMKVAAMLPQVFEVVGVVVRDEKKYEAFGNRWSVKLYESIEAIISEHSVDYVIVSVSKQVAREVLDLVKKTGLPILMETPTGNTKEELIDIEKAYEGYQIQVAEQYHLQPHHSARLKLIEDGCIGVPQHIYLSACHDYHAISLIRRYLGVGCPEFKVTAFAKGEQLKNQTHRYGVKSPSSDVNHVTAYIDFGEQSAVYDYNGGQYFSPIRESHYIIKGDNGEMTNNRVAYYDGDRFHTGEITREMKGFEGDLYNLSLDYLTFNGNVVWDNPYGDVALSDEELAIAICMDKMSDYVAHGTEFYSLKEACYDTLIGIVIGESIKEKGE